MTNFIYRDARLKTRGFNRKMTPYNNGRAKQFPGSHLCGSFFDPLFILISFGKENSRFGIHILKPYEYLDRSEGKYRIIC
jgi:hypothetical protein